jgi:hypothetical protein
MYDSTLLLPETGDNTQLIDHNHPASPIGQSVLFQSGSPLEEAIALVLRAEEAGEVPNLADWLARHPSHAVELAEFLAAQQNLFSEKPISNPATAENHALSKNSSLSGFEIHEELGRGGMGVVYRAYDRSLKRTVALKSILTGDLATERDLIRFRFEAESAAGLDHPAIVPVYAFGEFDSRPYLVMKLMEGGSLAAHLRQSGPGSKIAPHEAARLVRDVAQGVHHAHQRGLLHRDLKPANILLDADGVPHVADFGLAIVLKSTFSLSQGASMAGTAAYMAPEQVAGDAGLTTAVDIHALGAILYELITGEPPYGRDEWLLTIQRVRDDNPPDMRRACPDLPRDLEAIVLRCLEKDPRDRYSSALNLAEDLSHFLEGEPLATRRKGLLVGLGRAVSRRRDTTTMTSWPAFFVTAVSLIISQTIVMAVLLSGANPWLAYAGLGSHFLGWIVLYWLYLVMRSSVVSPVERMSTGLQLGIMLACFSLVPAHIYLHGNNILPIYPPMTTIFGLGVFAHGATHWGRLYLVGIYMMLVALMMPLVPMLWWPAAHGILHGAALVWMGLKHREFDRMGSISNSNRTKSDSK